MDQTKKERNTQRRKRTAGFESKGYDMWKLCGFRMLALWQNPDTGVFHSFRTMDKLSWNVGQIIADPKTQNKLPSDVEKTRSKRRPARKNRSKRAGREIVSHEVTPEKVISKDSFERSIMPFLSDPPLFGLSANVPQWDGLSRSQGALSKATRQDGLNGSNLSVQHLFRAYS